MHNGSLIRIRDIKHHYESGKAWTEWRPEAKQDVFLAILLGTEPKKPTAETRIDIEAAMNELGWVIDPKLGKAKIAKFRKMLKGEA